MLNHKANIINFLLLQSAVGLAYYFHYLGFIFLPLPFLLFLAVEIYGAADISSGFHFTSLCKGESEEKVVALTFDDGPDIENTTKIVAVLKEFNTQATFFCIGKNIAGKETLVKDIHEAGHLIGNHGFTHSFLFDLKGSSGLNDEIKFCNEAICGVIGKKPLLFRPPYGVSTPPLGRALISCGMTSIGWSIRSLDTSTHQQEKTLDRITKQLHPGAIILLHDNIRSNEILLKNLLIYLNRNQYRVVGLDSLLNIKAYA